MKNIFITTLLLISSLFCSGQEMWGIANSNYAGTMGLQINPASVVNSYIQREIHILSGDIFLNNNYIYIIEGTKPISKIISGQSIPEERFDDNYTTEDKVVFSNVRFTLPGYYYSTPDFGFAINFGLRQNTSVADFPYHLAKFFYEGYSYEPEHGQNFSSNGYTANTFMISEISLTLGKNFIRSGQHEINGGVTIQPTFGHLGSYISSEIHNYIVPTSEQMITYDMKAEYAHALPNFGNSDEEKFKLFKIRGTGVNGNVGFRYTRYLGNSGITTAYRNRRVRSYQFRLGASLLDVGFTNFSKDQASLTFDASNVVWNGIDTIKIESINYADSIFSIVFSDGPQTIDYNKKFKVYSPTALSFQFDYSISARFFAAANFITGLQLNDQTIVRPSQLSITPRYETPDFEVSLPFSLYRMKNSRIGLAGRYRWFVLGTDKLGPWLGMGDFYGLDIYFGIKFSTYPNSKAKNRKSNLCPAFD